MKGKEGGGVREIMEEVTCKARRGDGGEIMKGKR